MMKGKNNWRVTVLVENTTSRQKLLAEHGLSYLIETDSYQILFDTGQGLTLHHNAKHLGISLQTLNAVALSHGHYDHAGGLIGVLETYHPPKLFLHPAALQPKFSARGEIGFPIQDQVLLSQKVEQLIWTETLTEIIPGLYLTGSIPRVHPLENTGDNFWQDSSHSHIDLLLDDQALFLDTPKGIVVILGCAHAGVINTLNYMAQLTGIEKFYAVVGGMHLLNAKNDRLQATAKTFKKYDVQFLGANHCTGMPAMTFLWHHFPEKCISCNVGTHLEFST